MLSAKKYLPNLKQLSHFWRFFKNRLGNMQRFGLALLVVQTRSTHLVVVPTAVCQVAVLVAPFVNRCIAQDASVQFRCRETKSPYPCFLIKE